MDTAPAKRCGKRRRIRQAAILLALLSCASIVESRPVAGERLVAYVAASDVDDQCPLWIPAELEKERPLLILSQEAGFIYFPVIALWPSGRLLWWQGYHDFFDRKGTDSLESYWVKLRKSGKQEVDEKHLYLGPYQQAFVSREAVLAVREQLRSQPSLNLEGKRFVGVSTSGRWTLIQFADGTRQHCLATIHESLDASLLPIQGIRLEEPESTEKAGTKEAVTVLYDEFRGLWEDRKGILVSLVDRVTSDAEALGAIEFARFDPQAANADVPNIDRLPEGLRLFHEGVGGLKGFENAVPCFEAVSVAAAGLARSSPDHTGDSPAIYSFYPSGEIGQGCPIATIEWPGYERLPLLIVWRDGRIVYFKHADRSGNLRIVDGPETVTVLRNVHNLGVATESCFLVGPYLESQAGVTAWASVADMMRRLSAGDGDVRASYCKSIHCESTEIIAQDGQRTIHLISPHEQIEGSGEFFMSSQGQAIPLGGSTKEELLANETNEYRLFRQDWDIAKAALSGLIPNDDTKSKNLGLLWFGRKECGSVSPQTSPNTNATLAPPVQPTPAPLAGPR